MMAREEYPYNGESDMILPLPNSAIELEIICSTEIIAPHGIVQAGFAAPGSCPVTRLVVSIFLDILAFLN